MKQSFEEIRPIYVRKEKRTRGHVLVCMLAYIIIKYVCDLCKENQMESTHKHIFTTLDNIQYLCYHHKNIEMKVMPKQLLPKTNEVIKTLNIKLPDYL